MSSLEQRAVPIKIDEVTRNRIAILAKGRKQSSHAVMKKILLEGVDLEEKRDAFMKETLEAISEYEKTGLHLTSEEVLSWVKTWRTDDEIEIPECHV